MSDEGWLAAQLADLRHHWGSAYRIDCHGSGRWLAVRRDTGAALTADSALTLRDEILSDYTAFPVPREP
jgi:hypothetical protein